MAVTVLIVDDHPGFRAQARALLAAGGLEVVGEAADGEAAVLEAVRLDPDIVLLDVVLPTVDGFVVCERLVQTGRSAVVLTSSRAAQEYAGRLATSGARGFLPKESLTAEALLELAGRS